jgi:hypothetical protein
LEVYVGVLDEACKNEKQDILHRSIGEEEEAYQVFTEAK